MQALVGCREWAPPLDMTKLTWYIIEQFIVFNCVHPLNDFSFQPRLHDWCSKGCSMCYNFCGMMLL